MTESREIVMKIGLFADSHYSRQEVSHGNRYHSRSLGKIKQAYECFRKEACDLVVCLGDLIDMEDSHETEIENLRIISEFLSTQAIPTMVLMGNHDAFSFSVDEFYSVLGEAYRPKDLFFNGIQLLFLDACYFKNGRHYQPGDSDWTDTFYPCVSDLKEKLRNTDSPTYLFLHQNIDPTVPTDHCLSNSAQIRSLLEQSGVVKAVFQGHCHIGSQSEHGGINYVTLKAMCVYDNTWEVVEV